ncbi:MAG: YaeQ family protein [Bdellovibrionota bacterium]
MANTATLFRFKLDVSDIDRGYYDSLDLRLAMHPSETYPYLITRVLAYALNAQDGLQFSPGGLSDPDIPCIQVVDNGSTQLWIEIGNPSAKKLHRASKASKQVRVYTYKNVDTLMKELATADIHKAETIDIFAFKTDFLTKLEIAIERENRWTVIFNEGTLTVSTEGTSETTEIERLSLNA